MFPLALLPLPGELVPLHIFEPRYRQLLEEAEASDISFGIYFSHEINKSKIGSLMKLESVIKRYATGESDIIVKCIDIFSMSTLYRKFKNKSYPGGDVEMWNVDQTILPGEELFNLYTEYMALRKIHNLMSATGIFQIANELGLDHSLRYKFLLSDNDVRQVILLNRIKFLSHVLMQEVKSKDVYHLN
jgi:hypothetical protein